MQCMCKSKQAGKIIYIKNTLLLYTQPGLILKFIQASMKGSYTICAGLKYHISPYHYTFQQFSSSEKWHGALCLCFPEGLTRQIK